MSNDPLALSEVWEALPNEADYEAVCETIVATARGRWFLAEYSRRNRNADTRTLLDAITRVEGAIGGMAPVPAPGQASAVAYHDLAELAAAVDHIKAVIAIDNAEPPAGAAAIERVQDIAFALRERRIDARLCDALDAAARDLGALGVAAEAATQRAQRAYGLLRDLAVRIGDLMAQAGDGPEAIRRPGDLFAGDVAEGGSFAQAVAELAAVLPSLGDAAQSAAPAAPPSEAAAAPARRPQSEPARDAAEVFEPAADMPPPAAAAAAETAFARARPGDPFGILRELSEDELIALFS